MNTISRQINSMFILGFKGEEPSCELKELARQDLGGIIFFADNIIDRNNFKQTIKDFKEIQEKIILSIDQEGGRVQRTNNLPDAVEYISPLKLESGREEHYRVLSDELLDFGINMDFAPVLDVFTNPKDPIINERAFGKTSKEVIKYAQIQNKALQENGIKTVGKHFPGHGCADVDSHIDMPQIDLSLDELQEHIEPFKNIKTDAIMVAHAHYEAFGDDVLPASLSGNVIKYLKENVGFDGLIISDDMVMGGVAKHYTPLEACIKGIMVGIDMFIFREYTPDVKEMLCELEKVAQKDKHLADKIKQASEKVIRFKNSVKLVSQGAFDVEKARKNIGNIENSQSG